MWTIRSCNGLGKTTQNEAVSEATCGLLVVPLLFKSVPRPTGGSGHG